MKLLWLTLPLLLACGCGASNEVSQPTKSQPVAVAKVDPPRTDFPTEVALVRSGHKVHVGDKPDEAFQLLLAGRSGGFTSERLPAGFVTPYVVRAWEGADEGFGLVAYSAKVVCAMYQETKASQDRANEVRQAHQELMGSVQPEIISGDKVTYYFWDYQIKDAEGLVKGTQRLMIMVFQTGPSTVFLTTAMGDSKVMDGLGMNTEQARNDQVQADKIMQGREAGANSGKT
ncbi:MAG: hypothetical protein ACAH95_01015 [Fimbriimonas sp.]